jgi:hypothetical protein
VGSWSADGRAPAAAFHSSSRSFGRMILPLSSESQHRTYIRKS